MHPGFEKDYNYLLSHLIPRHLLSSEQLRGLTRALDSGDRLAIIRAAYRSMEELTERGVYKRDQVKRRGNTISVSYMKMEEASRITLTMAGWEWDEISGLGRRVAGLVPSVLAGIISSLSLNDSPKSLVARITEVIGLIGHVMPESEGFVLLLQEEPVMPDLGSDKIKSLSWSKLSDNAFYRASATGSGQHTFVPLRGLRPGGSPFRFRPEDRSVVLVPLSSAEGRWGVLEVHAPGEQPPDREVLSNLYLLTQGIVRLLENNQRLENMVSIDRLTQVHNRNYYESQVPLEIERANRDKKSLAFLIIDIDDFKGFNDRFGHDVGDIVLKQVAQTVRKHLRKIDLLFRYGGEEFIALLPGTDSEAAERTAERIREVLSKTGISTDGGRKIKVTISIGGCVYPDDAQNETELFRHADQALYVSKSAGKNRVTFYKSES